MEDYFHEPDKFVVSLNSLLVSQSSHVLLKNKIIMKILNFPGIFGKRNKNIFQKFLTLWSTSLAQNIASHWQIVKNRMLGSRWEKNNGNNSNKSKINQYKPKQLKEQEECEQTKLRQKHLRSKARKTGRLAKLQRAQKSGWILGECLWTRFSSLFLPLLLFFGSTYARYSE